MLRALCVFALILQFSSSALCSPGMETRKIRYVLDDSDEAMDSYDFFRHSDHRWLFSVDDIHAATKPVIKYRKRRTVISLYTNHYVDRSDGLVRFLVIEVERNWTVAARTCSIEINSRHDSYLISRGNDPEGFGRFVVAEMEKPRSAFLDRARCETAKPWMGRKGMFSG